MLTGSVVIPTFNRREILIRTLGYFLMQTGIGNNDFEIIVVDDGSTDGTENIFSSFNRDSAAYDRLSFNHRNIVSVIAKGKLSDIKISGGGGNTDSIVDTGVVYVKIKKSGRSVARNVAIELSKGEVIIFSDDDIFVEEKFVYKHLINHCDNDRLVIMGKVINTENIDNPFAAKWKLRDINTAFLATGNASVLKKYLLEAGLFDENYTIYGWEDFDLGVHLKEIGLKSIKKKIFGYHYNPLNREVNPFELYQKEKERGITAVYFYLNHPLPWVKRFTLINNKLLPFLVRIFAKSIDKKYNKQKKVKLNPVSRFIIRYSGYFDGIMEGKKRYL